MPAIHRVHKTAVDRTKKFSRLVLMSFDTLLPLTALLGMTSLTAGWWRWRVLSLRWQPVHHRG